jgi:hypothetical protein
MWCDPGMAPRNRTVSADATGMSLKFLTKQRPVTHCDHPSEVRLEIAGLSRSVCESCGRVSVGYVKDHFRSSRAHELLEIGSDEDDPDADV